MTENGYSLSDIQAATNGMGGFGGNEGMWIFALLILMFGGGGFGFGNRTDGLAQTDLNLLNAVQNGQRDIEARVQEVGGESISAVKDKDVTLHINWVQVIARDKNTFRRVCSGFYFSFLNVTRVPKHSIFHIARGSNYGNFNLS